MQVTRVLDLSKSEEVGQYLEGDLNPFPWFIIEYLEHLEMWRIFSYLESAIKGCFYI